MNLNKDLPLALSQASLQDFLECPRRFELRVLNDTLWPAAPSSPISEYELLTDLGNRFHQLCQQIFVGIDPDLISPTITDPELLRLWHLFLPYGRTLLKYQKYPEQILRIPFKDYFLVAKFDLIVHLSDNEFLIIDWKTSSRKPARSILSKKVQTLLYPFIFQQSGSDLFSIDEIPHSAIKMQYWYPLSSDPEELFSYSEENHLQVTQTITDLVDQIDEYIDSALPFPLTEDKDRCKYCIYRSYCDRGSLADNIPNETDLEVEDITSKYFDLDMFDEIEF